MAIFIAFEQHGAVRFAPLCLAVSMALLGGVVAGGLVHAQDTMPKTLHRTPPVYPYLAKVQGLTGHAVAEFTISERGETKNIRIIELSHEDFRAPTIDCIATWTYTPGTKDGKPAAVRARQRLDFNLVGEAAPLETQSFDGFRLDLNNNWVASVAAPDEALETLSMLQVRKGAFVLEIGTVATGEGEDYAEFAWHELMRRNYEAGVADGYELFDDLPEPQPFRRDVAGEMRHGFRVRVQLVPQRGASWMLYEVFRFTTGDREFHILVSHPTKSSTDDLLTLGAILNSLKPKS